jgi:hypothetical protein
MKVYFYDDNKHTVSEFKAKHPNVSTVYVKNLKKTRILNGMAGYFYPSMFAQKYPHNKYAQVVLQNIMKNDQIMHPQKKWPKDLCVMSDIEVGSGLTVPEINRIARVSADVVMLDWDLTLSVCNGVYIFPGYKTVYSATEMAQYFAGTIERFNALRKMFAELRSRGIKIIIFTDNGVAKSNLDQFFEIAQALDTDLSKNDIVYGYGIKAETFKTDKRLKPIYAANRNKTRSIKKMLKLGVSNIYNLKI